MKFRLTDIPKIKDFYLEIDSLKLKELNIIVGKNANGKSTLLSFLSNLSFCSKIIAVPMEPVPLCQQKQGHFTTTSKQVHLDDFMIYMFN